MTLANWTISGGTTAPAGQIRPPISVTGFEDLQDCPLQVVYRHDRNFPGRSGSSARVGTAFHKALEALPRALSATDSRAAAQQLVDVFRAALAVQREEAARNPRESEMSWPDARMSHAERSLALMANRLWTRSGEPVAIGTAAERNEVRVTSRDGLITGVIDHIEVAPGGPVLVDFKSAEHVDSDQLRRYRQQLLLYSYLWWDSTGTWPAGASIDLILLGQRIPVELSVEESELLAGQVRGAYHAATSAPVVRARPGDHCGSCAYRPWCGAFWNWNAGRGSSDRYASLEGLVVRVPHAAGPPILVLDVVGQEAVVVLDDRWLRFGLQLQAGDHVRIIDARVDGIGRQARYACTPWTETWLIT